MLLALEKITCRIITEGLKGTENQCVGVAEALGITPTVSRIQLRQPWKTLSPWLGFECGNTFSAPLMPPWPDLLITSGRKAVAASRYIKKQSKGKTVTVHIQDPKISSKHFDLVAVPAHDSLRGRNVVVTTGAPNRITSSKLEHAKKQFPEFATLPSPRVAVLIGGTSKAYTLTPSITSSLANDLKKLNAGLMITASRRTGPENERILRQALSDTQTYIWDGTGENPYFGLLAWANYILVTADSVSMLSEAATTGKPVYMIPMEGGAKRIDRLHQNLMQKGILRPFNGTLEDWRYPPLNDAGLVAKSIAELIDYKPK